MRAGRSPMGERRKAPRRASTWLRGGKARGVSAGSEMTAQIGDLLTAGRNGFAYWFDLKGSHEPSNGVGVRCLTRARACRLISFVTSVSSYLIRDSPFTPAKHKVDAAAATRLRNETILKLRTISSSEVYLLSSQMRSRRVCKVQRQLVEKSARFGRS